MAKMHSLEQMKEILSLVTFMDNGTPESGYLVPAAGTGLYSRVKKKGYRVIVDRDTGKEYAEHRLVYLEVHGYLPDILDHKDGNRLHNHPTNLRASTHAQNQWNRKGKKDARIPYKGVCFSLKYNKFRARINANNKTYHLGFFLTAEEAALAVNEAITTLHGQFACLNVI